MLQPTVSIIIPAYNAEKFINRSIDSVIAQTYSNWELIIVDDGSTDRTYEIVRSYEKKDKRIRSYKKKNEGQGIARNYGLIEARGAYVGFMDADDYIGKDMLSDMIGVAESNSADMVYSYMEGERYFRLPDDENSNLIKIFDTPKKKDLFRRNMMGCHPGEKDDSNLGMSVCRSIFKKNIIVDNNIAFQSERVVNSEDLLFNLDFIEACNTIAVIEKEYYMYCHDNPRSFSLMPNKNRYSMFKTLNNEVKKRCKDNDEVLRASRRFLANVRVTVVEKARWCTVKTYSEMKKDISDIVSDDYLINELKQYPINQLPKKQAIYFYLMLKKQTILLIIFAKLRYRFG